MHRYAVIDERGKIVNIAIYEQLVPDTSNLINIDKETWLSIGDMIDKPEPQPNPNIVVSDRLEWLDQWFGRIEHQQFRSVCGLIKSLCEKSVFNPKDVETFNDYEKQKEVLRSFYPMIDATGTDFEWKKSFIERFAQFFTK